jgi:hypothetical protein
MWQKLPGTRGRNIAEIATTKDDEVERPTPNQAAAV